MKPRNLSKLSAYFNKNFITNDDFYKFWTQKEALYKLNNKPEYTFITKFSEDYYVCAVSSKEIDFNPEFKEILF